MMQVRTGEPLDGVFLSPRVVDGVAFEELASSLRGLVTRADEQSASLGSAVGKCEVVVKQLSATGPAVESKLAAAAAAMKAMASRQAELESLLTRAEERAAAAERAGAELEARLAGDVESRAAAAEARIAAMVAAALGRIDAAAASVAAGLSDASGVAERAAEEAARRVEPLERRLLERAAEIEERLAGAERQARPLLGAGLRSLAVLCARAETILGARAGSLPDLVRRAEAGVEAVEFAAAQLGVVRERAEQAAFMLSGQVASSAQTVEGFAARYEALSGAMAETLASCEGARAALRDHAERHVRMIEAAVTAGAAATAASPAPRKRPSRSPGDPA